MKVNEYVDWIAVASSLDELERIIEEAAADDSLTNAEYTALYDRALTIAQTWNGL